MKRKERRNNAMMARKLGIDLDNPDLSIVTAHYTTKYIRVTTQESSYVINLEDRRAMRKEGDEASHLLNDSEWYDYDEIYSCSVGFPLRMTWYDGERLLLRETTLITEVLEFDDV